jgi:hypothetical protein
MDAGRGAARARPQGTGWRRTLVRSSYARRDVVRSVELVSAWTIADGCRARARVDQHGVDLGDGLHFAPRLLGARARSTESGSAVTSAVMVQQRVAQAAQLLGIG